MDTIFFQSSQRPYFWFFFCIEMTYLGATVAAARNYTNKHTCLCHFPLFFFLPLLNSLLGIRGFFSDMSQIFYPGSDSSAKKFKSERSIQGCRKTWMSPQANGKSVGVTFFQKKITNSILILSLWAYRTSHNLLFSRLQVIECAQAVVGATTLHVNVIFHVLDTYSISFLYCKGSHYENGKNGLFQHMISEHKWIFSRLLVFWFLQFIFIKPELFWSAFHTSMFMFYIHIV